MGRLNEAIDDTSKAVEKVTKTTRIGIVTSIVWVILSYLFCRGTSGMFYTPFNTEGFITFGILPLVVYWGWKFIKAARD